MSESKPNQIKVPVAILKAGETRSIQTVLEFPDPPVTFKLVEGSGPIYIHGQQVPGNYEIEDTVECIEEEEVIGKFSYHIGTVMFSRVNNEFLALALSG